MQLRLENKPRVIISLGIQDSKHFNPQIFLIYLIIQIFLSILDAVLQRRCMIYLSSLMGLRRHLKSAELV